MHRTNSLVTTALLGSAAALLAFGAAAADTKWHNSLDDGTAAARKSGRPVLVVTAWRSGI